MPEKINSNKTLNVNELLRTNKSNFSFKPLTSINTPNVPPTEIQQLVCYKTMENSDKISNSYWPLRSSFNDTLSLPSSFKILSKQKSFSKVNFLIL